MKAILEWSGKFLCEESKNPQLNWLPSEDGDLRTAWCLLFPLLNFFSGRVEAFFPPYQPSVDQAKHEENPNVKHADKIFSFVSWEN